MANKPLTLQDIYQQLGEVMATDTNKLMSDLKKKQTEESAELMKLHQQQRKALEDQQTEIERKLVELRAAIELVTTDGADPLAAVMATKGTAIFVMIGPSSNGLWMIGPGD